MSEQTPRPRLGRRIADRILETDYRAFTVFLLIAGPIIIILYDILPAVSKVLGDTISELTRLWSLKWHIIPAGVAVLCGHLFGPFSWRTPGWITLTVLLTYGLTLIALGLKGWAMPRTYIAVCIIFHINFWLGATLWGQGDVRIRFEPAAIEEPP